jgi:hypothetical protein
MIDFKVGLACIAALELAACATEATLGGAASPRVVADGRSVYVVNVSTEQEGRASAVSVCRGRGGTAVFSEIVQYRHSTRFRSQLTSTALNEYPVLRSRGGSTTWPMKHWLSLAAAKADAILSIGIIWNSKVRQTEGS